MTPLQQAAQAVIDRWDSPSWKDEPPTAVVIGALSKALADEQAQAVEPVAWMYDWEPDEEVVTDWLTTDYDEAHSPTMGHRNIRPLYMHPASPATGERAELIDYTSREALVIELRQAAGDYSLFDKHMGRDAADMLESDASLINEGNKAQQVAVPDGYVLVPIEPTPAILDAMSSSGWKTACYKAMLAVAQGAKP